MRRLLALLALSTAAAAAPAAAQDTTGTIDPGMSKAQVIARLGKPVSERSDGVYTFLYYKNGCEKTCGMQDLVVLENDAVTDAIFRSRTHHYTGVSSSPSAVNPRDARAHRPTTLTIEKAPPAAPSMHDSTPAPADTAHPASPPPARPPTDTSHHS
jgi:hypothetical protein